MMMHGLANVKFTSGILRPIGKKSPRHRG